MPPPSTFQGRLFDAESRPLAGARVRAEVFCQSSSAPGDRQGSSIQSYGYTYLSRDLMAGSPLQTLLETTTNADGTFTLRDCPKHDGIRIGVTTSAGTRMRARSKGLLADSRPAAAIAPPIADPSRPPGPDPADFFVDPLTTGMGRQGFIAAIPGQEVEFVARPAARLAGRVVSGVPGVDVAGLVVWVRDKSRPVAQGGGHVPNMQPPVGLTGDDGRFAIDGLEPNMIEVVVRGAGLGQAWVHRAVRDVSLAPGRTAEVEIELSRGVQVEGQVRLVRAGTPVEGVLIFSYDGSRFPKTDARGRFRFLMAPGQTSFYISGTPPGFLAPKDQSVRNVTIPEDVTRFEIPPMEVSRSVTIHGRVIDAAGNPIVGAVVLGVAEGEAINLPMFSREAVTDASGAFRLQPSYHNTVASGNPVFLRVRLADGTELSVKATPAADGEVEIKVNLPVVP